MSNSLIGLVLNSDIYHFRWSPDTYTRVLNSDEELKLIPSRLPFYKKPTLSSQAYLNSPIIYKVNDISYNITLDFVEMHNSSKNKIKSNLIQKLNFKENQSYVFCCLVERTQKGNKVTDIKYGQLQSTGDIIFSSYVSSFTFNRTTRVKLDFTKDIFRTKSGDKTFNLWISKENSKTLSSVNTSSVEESGQIQAQFLSSVGSFFSNIFGTAWKWVKIIFYIAIVGLVLGLIIYIIFKANRKKKRMEELRGRVRR